MNIDGREDERLVAAEVRVIARRISEFDAERRGTGKAIDEAPRRDASAATLVSEAPTSRPLSGNAEMRTRYTATTGAGPRLRRAVVSLRGGAEP